MNEYNIIDNLENKIDNIPPESIVSRTIHNDNNLKVTLFGFAENQELSEHTASQPAVIYILKGKVDISLGGNEYIGNSGTWIHMPPNLPHSIHARSETLMVLYLIKS